MDDALLYGTAWVFFFVGVFLLLYNCALEEQYTHGVLSLDDWAGFYCS